MYLVDFVLTWVRKLIIYGYISHFIVGIIIGAYVSIHYYNRSNKKINSFILSIIFVSFIGVLKEVVDPSIGRDRDLGDIFFTCLGGIIGGLAIFSEKLLQLIYRDRNINH